MRRVQSVAGLGLCLPRLPSGRQRLRRRASLGRRDQQTINRDIEGSGETLNNVDCRVHFALFDPADVGRSDARIDRQLLLAQLPSGAESPNIKGQTRPSIHGRRARNLHALIHDVYDRYL